MQIHKQISPAGFLYFALGLLLLGLWGAVLIDKRQEILVSPSAGAQGLYIALPNILAPVIRSEVHKDKEDKQDGFVNSISVPALLRGINVSQ